MAARLSFMSTQPPIANTNQDLACLCKAAGDNLRLDILRALARDSYGVLELAEAFAVKQSLMSHHLKTLTQAGLVSSRREGNSIFYRRAPLEAQHPLSALKCSLFASLDKTWLSHEPQQRLKTIHQERAATAQAFFIENAAKFRAQQDLIASYSSYAAAVSQLLLNSDCAVQRALEVGPGEGEFLEVLSARFERVLALDTSTAMLAQAEQFAAHKQLRNINFRSGDTQLLWEFPAAFDCAVINMVLHHVPSPAQMILDVAASLRPGGLLLITDLCRHEQYWAKEACGDLWMGFDPDQLIDWAKAAELQLGQSTWLALRNGFQIQIHQFHKAR